MSTIHVLWADLRIHAGGRGLARLVSGRHAIDVVAGVNAIADAVRSGHPDVACVEFDYPGEAQLLVVPAIRREFPALPILMFTEYHSEALAVRAFRWGVWDYRVKPVSAAILARSIQKAVNPGNHPATGVHPVLPADVAAPSDHLRSPVVTTIRTARAVAYLVSHYRKPITRAAMASRCHLSVSEFSRAFRREHQCTFERFLLEFRVDRARELLMDSALTVTQVAHAVGFNDSSYFARAFRRVTGASASDWRRQTRGTPTSEVS